MARDPRYDILLEPVKIRPVTTKNRFLPGTTLFRGFRQRTRCQYTDA